jgi:polar amino acid transport system substrate-binding protein
MHLSGKFKTLFFLFSLLSCVEPVAGREFSLAMSGSIPPYVIKDGNRGIYLDIMQEALALKGHSIGSFHYVTNKRMLALLNSGRVDAILNAPPIIQSGYPSMPLSYFENVLVSRADKGLEIRKVLDLKDLRMIAFQNASSYLGESFKAMTQRNERYSESTLQINQVRHLYLDRTDIILLDRRIFEYYRQALSDTMDVIAPVKIHRIFPKVPRTAVFLDSDITNEFNDGLRQLEASGRLKEINEQYLN